VRGPAAQDARASGASVGPARGHCPPVAGRRSGRAAQAAPHRPPGVAAATRGYARSAAWWWPSRPCARSWRRSGRRDVSKVTVPQEHAPGEEAEVDFGEFRAESPGCWSACGCSSCACPGQGGGSRWRSPTRPRRPSLRATCAPSPTLVGCRLAGSLRQPQTGGHADPVGSRPGGDRAVHHPAQPLRVRLLVGGCYLEHALFSYRVLRVVPKSVVDIQA
jgi:hypothetical protein